MTLLTLWLCCFDSQFDAFIEVLFLPVNGAEAVHGVEVHRVEFERLLQVRLCFVGAEWVFCVHARHESERASRLSQTTVRLTRARVCHAHSSDGHVTLDNTCQRDDF